MPYTFRIIFSGLCAFVADRRFDDAANPPIHATVLLRDLRQGLTLGSDEVPPHFARIELDPRNVRRPASTRDTEPDGAIVRSILAKEDLEIILPRGVVPDGLVTKSQAPDDIVAPTGNSKRSLFFVPTIDQVEGQAMRVKRALLGQLQRDEPLLAGRVGLTAGNLFTSELQDGTWALAAVGRKRSGLAPTGHRLAESVALEIGGITGNVELRFTPFGGGTASTLVVGPSEENPLADVVVDLKNKELPEPKVDTPPDHDLDFAIYFDLLEPFTDALPRVIPHLLSAQPVTSVLVSHIGGCTPAELLSDG